MRILTKLTEVLLLVTICLILSSTSKPTENATEVWTRLERRVQYLAKEGSIRVWNWIKNQSSEMQISDDCRESLFNLLKDVGGLKRWATQMVDATAKPMAGIVNGKLGFYGNYDECVEIAVPTDYESLRDMPDSPYKFRGQYCLVDVRPPLPKMGRFLYHWHFLPPLKNLSQRARIKTVRIDTIYTRRPGYLADKVQYQVAWPPGVNGINPPSLKTMAYFPLYRNWNNAFSSPFTFLLNGMGYIYDLPFRTAICAPSTCSRIDLERLLVKLVSPYSLKVHVDNCSIKKPIVLTNDLIVTIVVLTFLLSLVVIATLTDYKLTKPIVRQRARPGTKKPPPPSTRLKVLYAFSLRRNLRNLLSTRKPRDTTFTALSGIRFLTMVWVVFGHTTLSFPPFFYRHGKQAHELMSDFVMQFMYNAFLSVDTFFFVSSTLFSYFTVTTVSVKGLRAFNIPIIVVRRIWRLLPMELLVLGIAELATLLNKAPLWNEFFENQTKVCRRNWWTILFFVQDLIYPKDACHLHLWYVAMDFQFLLVTIVYLLTYFRNPLAGKILNFFIFAGGIITSCLVTYYRGFPPSIHMVQTNLREFIEFFQFWYLLPYSHISVCAVGMFVGTFLAQKIEFHISRRVQAVGWILSMIGFAAPVYTTYFWHFGRDIHPAEISLYNGLHRPIWALSLSWLTIMCATGRGGFINELLSWKGFLPLNRSSYVLYLIHITVCQYFLRSFTGHADTTKAGLFWCFFANVFSSYIVSVILRVLFEAPLEELDKIFLGRLLTRARDSSPNRKTKTKQSLSFNISKKKNKPEPGTSIEEAASSGITLATVTIEKTEAPDEKRRCSSDT